ncbi:MAG: phospholipase [Moraxellaceae bacterium]|nr:MAG: phospholipase [Moraxellaceae bacterium]
MKFRIILLVALWVVVFPVKASTKYEACILSTIAENEGGRTVDSVQEDCIKKSQRKKNVELGAISKRILEERLSQWNRFVITPHKQNYILPFTHTSRVNRDAYEFTGDWADELKHFESKFQISLKVPLNHKDIFTNEDALYVGFTINSWWQVYAGEISAPFRETNYQPEIFYLMPLELHPFGGNTGLVLGFEHQSNGRAQNLSRSWNRLYTSFLWEKGNTVVTFKPWFRIPEEKKKNIGDSEGDDNPDIEDFMGHFELRGSYQLKDQKFAIMGRNNLRPDNKGAIEISWSFPFYGHLKGFVQYFNGYGESLVDYNVSQERIGIGILLTDIL